jgi:hypothetical protein
MLVCSLTTPGTASSENGVAHTKSSHSSCVMYLVSEQAWYGYTRTAYVGPHGLPCLRTRLRVDAGVFACHESFQHVAIPCVVSLHAGFVSTHV